ncbi:MAG: hypothetical protein WAU86_02995 [Oricola sp.]
MSAIASISGSLGMPAGASARASSTEFGASGVAGAEDVGVEAMLLDLEQHAIRYKVALRVQEVGMPSQPLSRIDVTDLALMIVSGSFLSRALDIVEGRSPGGEPPAGYRQRW